jgi:uncharacterized protein (TIGR04255 family)
MDKAGFRIDLNESFEHLPGAPIAEALIHWRARAGKTLTAESFQTALTDRLTDYPAPKRQHQLQVGAEIAESESSVQQRQVWHGVRFESENKLHVAQFTRNGFVFSRLKPYTNWEDFVAEAIRLWDFYVEFAEPPEIERLGVRFINVISLDPAEELANVLASPPVAPTSMRLPVGEFMHQTKFDIPDHDYSLNVIQTIQQSALTGDEPSNLILDLDVFTNQTPAATDENLKERLADMRWIKNKAFFTFLTESVLSRFKE